MARVADLGGQSFPQNLHASGWSWQSLELHTVFTAAVEVEADRAVGVVDGRTVKVDGWAVVVEMVVVLRGV
jgi:hypothetical protein